MASPTLSQQLVFIGGGRMAEALIHGILARGLVAADRILVVDPADERRNLLAQRFQVAAVPALEAEWVTDGIWILAVKPQVMAPVLEGLVPVLPEDQLVVSIAAGVGLATIAAVLAPRRPRLVRVMPNTPALVGAGAAGIAGGPGATETDLATVLAIFNAVGRAVVVAEKDLDAVTGLSGSGPAYVFSFIEALIDAGVEQGLARPVAEELAVQTVLGSARLLQEQGEHPAVLRAMVTSPGGTTIAGLRVMERAGFAGVLMDAVAAASERSRELGRG